MAESTSVQNEIPPYPFYRNAPEPFTTGMVHKPYFMELSPRFPEKKETLSLDDGFDQTPVLKEILGYYRDCKSSSDIGSHLVQNLYYWNSKEVSTTNKKKLNVIYSKVAPSVVSVSSFHGLERKIDCSGLIIDWKSSENEATILTSAKLLLSPKNSNLEFHICEGGPLITDTGDVVGVNFFCEFACPLPTLVILTCLEMWRSFSTVVRPWVGMSVVDVNQLSYNILEKLNISPEDSYVVVKKVYKGSLADKHNVRSGDLVATLNGTLIRSAKQYSQLFLSETSQAACGDSCQQSFTVVINAFDRRIDNISIKADYISAEDKRLLDCWLQITDGDWYSQKHGSQRNQPCYGQGRSQTTTPAWANFN